MALWHDCVFSKFDHNCPGSVMVETEQTDPLHWESAGQYLRGELQNSKLIPAFEMAAREFYDERVDLSYWASDEDFERSFNSKPDGTEGASIMDYFRFLRFVIVSNVLMTIWCFIGWIPHVQNARPKLDKEGLGPSTSTYDHISELLFLSSYQPSSDSTWLAMVILGSITMILSGPLYLLHFKYLSREEEHKYMEDKIERTNRNGHIETDAAKTRLSRTILSYVMLVVICLVPIGINYSLLYVANHKALKVIPPCLKYSYRRPIDCNGIKPASSQLRERTLAVKRRRLLSS